MEVDVERNVGAPLGQRKRLTVYLRCWQCCQDFRCSYIPANSCLGLHRCFPWCDLRASVIAVAIGQVCFGVGLGVTGTLFFIDTVAATAQQGGTGAGAQVDTDLTTAQVSIILGACSSAQHRGARRRPHTPARACNDHYLSVRSNLRQASHHTGTGALCLLWSTPRSAGDLGDGAMDVYLLRRRRWAPGRAQQGGHRHLLSQVRPRAHAACDGRALGAPRPRRQVRTPRQPRRGRQRRRAAVCRGAAITTCTCQPQPAPDGWCCSEAPVLGVPAWCRRHLVAPRFIFVTG